MKKVVKKIGKDMTSLVKKHINNTFEESIIPGIKESILNDYELMLNDRVTDRKSRTRPERYMDDFIERLEDFEYIVMADNEANLVVPSMDNFDFSGKLRVLEIILEGTSGIHVEVDEEQYEKMYKKPPRLLEPFDPTVRKKDRIYLLRATGGLRRRMRENRIDYVRYPFSNTPPINIFESTSEYVENELLSRSINMALIRAEKEFVKTFRV